MDRDKEEYRGRRVSGSSGGGSSGSDSRRSFPPPSSGSQVELFSIHQCKVAKVEKYGAFLDFTDGLCDERGRPRSGLLHVSQMAETRVENPEMVVEVGEKLWAKVIRIDVKWKQIIVSKHSFI